METDASYQKRLQKAMSEVNQIKHASSYQTESARFPEFSPVQQHHSSLQETHGTIAIANTAREQVLGGDPFSVHNISNIHMSHPSHPMHAMTPVQPPDDSFSFCLLL